MIKSEVTRYGNWSRNFIGPVIQSVRVTSHGAHDSTTRDSI